MSDGFKYWCESQYEETDTEVPKNKKKKKNTMKSESMQSSNKFDMNKAAVECVRRYVLDHLDKSDTVAEFSVYVVWQCYILGDAKWLISTTLPDGMYYEVTYNSVAEEVYLDAYKKFENKQIPLADFMENV